MSLKSIYLILTLLVLVVLVSCGTKSSKSQVSVNNEEMSTQVVQNEMGELTYKKHCMVCHQRDASGIPKMYPPLVDNKVVSGDKTELIKILLNGMSGEIEVNGEKYNGVMSGYRNLSDNELASVLNYLRSGFKNDAEEITPAEVGALR
nr:cytochrome c [uncultured Carboxylicivirga sp.]